MSDVRHSFLTTDKHHIPVFNTIVFLCGHPCFSLYQVQLLTAPSSISHRHPQGKGETAPEASSLIGAAPAQGAPGEQGPAGRYILLSCMNK